MRNWMNSFPSSDPPLFWRRGEPARGSALAVSLPQALSQQVSAIEYPSRQIPSRTSNYTL